MHFVCIYLHDCVQADRAKREKETSLSCFPPLLQRRPTPIVAGSSQVEGGGRGLTKAINNQVWATGLCVMWSSPVFHFCTQGAALQDCLRRALCLAPLSTRPRRPGSHRPVQECTTLFTGAVIWLLELGLPGMRNILSPASSLGLLPYDHWGHLNKTSERLRKKKIPCYLSYNKVLSGSENLAKNLVADVLTKGRWKNWEESTLCNREEEEKWGHEWSWLCKQILRARICLILWNNLKSVISFFYMNTLI